MPRCRRWRCPAYSLVRPFRRCSESRGAAAGSAAGTLLLARMSEDRELLDASADVAEAGLSEGEARELFGGKDRS